MTTGGRPADWRHIGSAARKPDKAHWVNASADLGGNQGDIVTW
jgi:hypothetical protein